MASGRYMDRLWLGHRMSTLNTFRPTSLSPFAFHSVDRPLPDQENLKIYGMKLRATVEVRAKSIFWSFLRKLEKLKRISSKVLAIKEDPLMIIVSDGDKVKKGVNGHDVVSFIATCITSFGIYCCLDHLVLNRLNRVQDVICWQEKCIQGFDALFSCVIVSMILIISASVTVSPAPTWALTEDNQLFLEAWKTIDRAYLDKTFNGQNWFRYRENALRAEPMNTREETYMAIKKMLSTLDDPYTRFLEPEKFKSLRSGTEGTLTGVGISIGYPTVLDASSTNLVVVSAIPGGPANKSGVKPGDFILAINDISTKDMDIYEAAELLQGTEGSRAILEIRSGPVIKHIVLRREKITLNPVKSKLCEVVGQGKDRSRVGYIKLTSFNQNSSGALRDAILSLRGSVVQSFVLDLRDNSGGLFAEGIETAKIWLDKGVIVYICDSRGIRDIYETDGSNAVAVSEPLVVLVNKGTASASEILAGALKDNRRAVLYGEPTFGKGKIQSVFELFDGSGLVVTVARYETPAHTDIDKVGIIPDEPLPPSFPIDENSFCGCLSDAASLCSFNIAPLFPTQK